MDVKVTWKERLSFEAEGETKFVLPLGADPKVGGDNDGFRPMELIALGLAGCTAMDVISILQKKRQEVTSFEVLVHADRAVEHPKVFTQAQIEYIFTGRNLDESAILRAIELSAVRYCPAQAMFSDIMPIELKYKIYQLLEDGQQEFLKSGEFIQPKNQ